MAKEKKNAPAMTAASWLKGWIPYALLSLLVFLLYARTLGFDYTNLDDTSLIKDNGAFLGSSGAIAKAFSQNVFNILQGGDSYYRPLLTVSFIIDYSIGKDSLTVYHFTNLLLHALACCLLFRLLMLFGYRRDLVFIVCVLFAVHPAFTQAIAWIPGRNDTLLAVFTLSSFIFFVRWRETKKLLHFGLHLLLFTAALFTKETTLLAAFLFALYGWMESRRKKENAWKPLLLPAVCWAALVLLFLFARSSALADQSHVPMGEVATQVMSSTPALIPYLGKLLLPFQLSVFPVLEDLNFIRGIIALVVIAAGVFMAKGKNKGRIFFGVCWLLLLLLPSLIHAKQGREQNFLEHRLYLPAFGLALIVLEIMSARLKEKTKRPLLIPAIVAGIFAVLTFLHSVNFKDEEAFWSSATKASPHSSYAWGGLGIYYHDKNEPDKAQPAYEQALQLAPNAESPLKNLGVIYLRQGRNEEARQLLRRRLTVAPGDAVVYDWLGEALFALDSLDAAETAFKKSLEINPGYPDAMTDLAAVYAKRGNFDAAITLWQKVETLQPSTSAATQNLMLVLSMQKKYEEAEVYRQKLLKKGIDVPPLQRDTVK